MNHFRPLLIASIVGLGGIVSAYQWLIHNPSHTAVSTVFTADQSSGSVLNDPLSTPEKPSTSNIEKPRFIAPNITFDTYQSSFGPLPKSLQGTQIPAAFEVDENGHLIVTASVKSVIEYFLSTIGEEPLETILARIEEFFHQQLDEPASHQAVAVLNQFIDYKKTLAEMEKNLAEDVSLSGKSSDYLTMFQYRREARMNNLSPEVYDAFFADEDKEDSYTASLIEIQKNNALTQEEKNAQAIAMEQLLPPQEQQARQAERTRENLNQTIQTARQSGASEQEIFQMRSEIYGYEAAERFAAADAKKAEWNTRFEDYRNQRSNIISNEGLSEEDKTREIQAIQSALFNPREQRRLITLDRMADRHRTNTTNTTNTEL